MGFFQSDTQSILDALDRSQAVIHFEPNGTITWANNNFLKTLGYTLEEIKGRHHRIFVDPNYSQSHEYREFWEALQGGHFQSAQYKRFGKGGKVVWIQATYNPVLDKKGKVIKVVKFATDITIQTMKMQEALDRTQAVIHFNMDGIVQEANQNFLNALGYTLDEIVGQHHSMFVEPSYAATDDYRKFWDNLRRGEFQAGEFRRVGKGGREVWIQASYNPYFDSTGKPIKVVKYASDITRTKQVRTQTNEMMAAVAAATHELTGSIGEIAKSMSTTRDSVQSADSETKKAATQVGQLANAATAMSAIVNLIEDISNQINLLALNAAIEAARAGDAGRGFSVVADEVKKLASQTSSSTSKITEEIGGIQKLSTEVTSSLRSIENLMNGVSEGSSSVAAATEEQSTVVNDISNQMVTITNLINS